MYLGLSSTSVDSRPAGSAWRSGGGVTVVAGASGGWLPERSTVKVTSRFCPSVSCAAPVTKPWKWLSIQSRVKSFGTATTSPPSPSDRGSACANQVS